MDKTLKEAFIIVKLPIYPKDVFRLLALRSITAMPCLFDTLLESFENIKNGITQTPRLNIKEFDRKPFEYTHEGLDFKERDYSKMTERQLCAGKNAFFGKDFDGIGNVIDYELPLDDKKDSAFGKIDLVSFSDNKLFLLEVKKIDSNEHPLRAAFEIFTFWKTLADKDGGFKTFIEAYRESSNGAHLKQKVDVNHPENISVLPGLLLCEDSDIFTALCKYSEKENGNENYSHQAKLMQRFMQKDIGMQIFSYSSKTLEVTDKTEDIKQKLGIS